MSWNKIGDLGVAAMAQAMESNSTVQCLDLSNTGAATPGVVVMAESLWHNKRLQRVVLAGCNTTEDGLKTIIEAVVRSRAAGSIVIDLSDVDLGVRRWSLCADSTHPPLTGVLCGRRYRPVMMTLTRAARLVSTRST